MEENVHATNADSSTNNMQLVIEDVSPHSSTNMQLMFEDGPAPSAPCIIQNPNYEVMRETPMNSN